MLRIGRGDTYLPKYTLAPSALALPPFRVHYAFFSIFCLMEMALDVCRLFGVIRWQKGDVGYFLRKIIFFSIKSK